MRSLLAILVLIVPLATALDFPGGLDHGIYELSVKKYRSGFQTSVVSYDIDPSVNITARQSHNKYRFPFASGSCKTTVYGVHRLKNHLINAEELQTAEDRLANWCELYDPKPDGAVVSVQGNTTMYICAWGKGKDQLTIPRFKCSAKHVHMASWNMDATCGVQKLAWVGLRDPKMRYGRTTSPDHICEDIGHGIKDENDLTRTPEATIPTGKVQD